MLFSTLLSINASYRINYYKQHSGQTILWSYVDFTSPNSRHIPTVIALKFFKVSLLWIRLHNTTYNSVTSSLVAICPSLLWKKLKSMNVKWKRRWNNRGSVRTFLGAHNRQIQASVNFKVKFITESGLSYRKNPRVRMQPYKGWEWRTGQSLGTQGVLSPSLISASINAQAFCQWNGLTSSWPTRKAENVLIALKFQSHRKALSQF